MQTVRFYEDKGPDGATCYLEEKWGLIALHIIHKTPTAPAFIYATFEQAENIRQPNRKPVEDREGNLVDAIPGAGPTTPPLFYQDSNLPPGPKVIATEPFCRPRNNLYFEEITGNTGLPVGGAICINQRYEPISPDVIKENKIAHRAIARYDAAQRYGIRLGRFINWFRFSLCRSMCPPSRPLIPCMARRCSCRPIS